MAAVLIAAERLECPICLELPEAEVHQCVGGHCYCLSCWNNIQPRRCPECRQPILDYNRNLTNERVIAALEARCQHCGEATTRALQQYRLCYRVGYHVIFLYLSM